MAAYLDILFFIIAAIFLIASANLLMRSLKVMARFLRLSEFVTAFIILAIGTSLPELFIAITSGLNKNTSLSLGNVIGANILDLTLIIGIPILIARGIKLKSEETYRDSKWMLVMVALPLILMAVGHGLSRIDGAVLILAFAAYSWRLIREQREFRKPFEKNRLKRGAVVLNFIIFVVSFIVLFYSADFAIEYATRIAASFLIPPIFLGLFILSFGTTLPELITTSIAARKREPGVVLGNMVGTVIANSTLVLGVAALIWPIQANFVLFLTSGFFLLLVSFIFVSFLRSGKHLDWTEGVALIMLYVFFLIVEMSIKGFTAFVP